MQTFYKIFFEILQTLPRNVSGANLKKSRKHKKFTVIVRTKIYYIKKITLQSRMTISLKAINTSPPLLSYSELFFSPPETRYTAGISQA